MSTTTKARAPDGILVARTESSPLSVDTSGQELRDDFYSRIKSSLFWRIGRELRAAGRVLDLGCGQCDLARYLNKIYRQRVTGVDLSSKSFPKPANLPAGVPIRCVRGDAQRLDLFVCASSKRRGRDDLGAAPDGAGRPRPASGVSCSATRRQDTDRRCPLRQRLPGTASVCGVL